MTPAQYFALCTCPRTPTGRDLNPRCPFHSLPIPDRLALMEAAQ